MEIPDKAMTFMAQIDFYDNAVYARAALMQFYPDFQKIADDLEKGKAKAAESAKKVIAIGARGNKRKS